MTHPSNESIVAELRKMLEDYDEAWVARRPDAENILAPLYEDPIRYAEAAVAVIGKYEKAIVFASELNPFDDAPTIDQTMYSEFPKAENQNDPS